tara:strand:- start:2202 stop:5867 length:3666 start_codon:yes stop_codon:yes gene_type:complete
MMMKNRCYKAIISTLLCAILTACGGGGEQSGDQLLNSAGDMTDAERASRDSAVYADAGEDLIVEVNTEIAVDGSNSYDDLATDTLTLTWALIDGPSAAVIDSSLSQDGHFLLSTDTPGTYTIELTVTDGYNTSTDTMTVTVVEAEPTAILPETFSAQTGTTVTISGINSYDAMGSALSYEWAAIAPDGSDAFFESNESSDTITLELSEMGEYTVTLTVSDENGNVSSPAQTVVTSSNIPPNANAGADIEVSYNTRVELSASDSSDSEQDSLTYSWLLEQKPSGSNAALLGDINAVDTAFFADLPGQYVLEVTVSDGYSSSTDTIVVLATNTPPEITLPDTITIQSGQTASLEAIVNDPETDDFVYSWALLSQPNGSVTSIDNDTAELNVILHTGGTYRFELSVSDEFDTATASVDVLVNNSLPISVINISENDQRALAGETIRLSGENSYDPDAGDSIEAYEWTVISAPDGSVSGLTSESNVTTGLTPDIPGEYTIALRTFDGGNYSESTSVVITVINSNTAPVAIANYSFAGYTEVYLDGSLSNDADGHTISYLWNIIAKPDGVPAKIADRTAETTQLHVQENGTYAIRLIVSDGRTNSAPYDFTISIDRPNAQPVANAGLDQSAGIDQNVTVNGSESYDVDGDAITFSWFLTTPDGSTASLSDSSSVTPSFTPDIFGEYTAHLTVSDGNLVSEPQTVTITVDNSHAPVADAGRDQNVKTGSRVSLSGANSIDVDSEIESYTWYIHSKPVDSTTILDATNSISTSFTPDVDGTYVIALEVNDESLTSEPSFVSIVASTDNSAPIANAGADVMIVQGMGTSVRLNGGISTDADADELSYYWSLIRQPTLSETTLSNRTNQETLLSLDRYGEYLVQLTVFDGTVSSVPDTKLIQYVRSPREVDAGIDQEVYTREIVVLDGRSSGYISNREPDDYSYEWEFISTPTEDTIQIVEYVPDENEEPEDVIGLYQFQPPEPGTYVARLRFRNLITGTVSDVDTVIITVKPYNRLPTANAGDDVSTTVGEILILDGSSSTDTDGDILSYNWSIIERPLNSQATIQNPTSINPFIEVDAYGEYIIQLQVFDGSASSDPDVVIINAVEPSVSLDLRTDNGFRSLNLPYNKVETLEVTNPLDDSEYLLDTFRITAIEQQVTIHNIVAYDANGIVTPYMDIDDNTVIRDGSSLEIQLLTNYPDIGRQANIVFEFTIKETGETVSVSYLFSAR